MKLSEIHNRLKAAPKADHTMLLKWVDALIEDIAVAVAEEERRGNARQADSNGTLNEDDCA